MTTDSAQGLVSVEEPEQTSHLGRKTRPETSTSTLTSAAELAPATVMEFSGNENFPVASWFLPREIREDLLSIYGFARLVDQIGDDASGDRLTLLDELEDDLGKAYGDSPQHPLLRTLSRTIQRRQIPQDPFLRLIEANRLDQRLHRISTWQELLDYCDLSANPVGELVLYVFEQSNAQNIKWSNSVCSALQVVEHCQDVGEDFECGRVYLPASDLEAHGCDVSLLGQSPAPAPDAVRRVVGTQVARARELLVDAKPLVAALHGWAKPAVAGYAGGGLATCDALEAAQFDSNSLASVRPRKWRIFANTMSLLMRRGRSS